MGRILLITSLITLAGAFAIFLLFENRGIAIYLLIATLLLCLTGWIVNHFEKQNEQRAKRKKPERPITME